MQKIIAWVFLIPALCWPQMVMTGNSRVTQASPALSVLASKACFGGGSGTITTGSVDTTGAKIVVVAVGGTVTSISDNKGNGSATKLTSYAGQFTGAASTLYYWINPTVGSGHTFTLNGANLASACVIPVVGGSGVYDGTNNGNGASGTATSTSCPTGSITPGTGAHIVITMMEAAPSTSGAPLIDSSFTAGPYNPGADSNHFATASAYLIQSAGSAVSPTWTWNGAGTTSCAIASFH